MEGEKQVASSSSLTMELFGSNDHSVSSSSSGVFGSIFATNSNKGTRKESFCSEAVEKKQDFASQAWSTKHGHQDANLQNKEGENLSAKKKELSSYYNEQKLQPCHLSSSIYYGGQEVYSSPQSARNYSTDSVNKILNFCKISDCVSDLTSHAIWRPFLQNCSEASTIKMREKMTRAALREGTGGKEVSITESASPSIFVILN